MKALIQFLPHALIIGILAGIMQWMDLMSHGYFYSWIGFASWACYFLGGCTPKGGAKASGCWVAGLIASILIIELGNYLTGLSGAATIGFPVSVLIIATLVILCEKVPVLAFIPAWFVGAACFFAVNNAVGGDYHKSVPIY
ncbi:MAG: DUF1097 domain-containing protein, partial [Kiritimatiellia bacterium]